MYQTYVRPYLAQHERKIADGLERVQRDFGVLVQEGIRLGLGRLFSFFAQVSVHYVFIELIEYSLSGISPSLWPAVGKRARRAIATLRTFHPPAVPRSSSWMMTSLVKSQDSSHINCKSTTNKTCTVRLAGPWGCDVGCETGVSPAVQPDGSARVLEAAATGALPPAPCQGRL